MRKAHISLLSLFLLSPTSGFAAQPLLTSAPAISVAQAQAGNVRLVAWELPNGNGIEAQALDAATHEPLPDSSRLALGEIGKMQTRPAVAGLATDSGAVFLVVWHAEILDAEGNPAGAEIIGQRVVIGENGSADIGSPTRISRVDDDTSATATSETRSAPVVVASDVEDEFLVVWTHWPNGRTLHGDPLVSNSDYFIYGQELGTDGTMKGSAAVQLDAQTAPHDDNGLPARNDLDPIFIAAVPRVNEAGYLLAWSDPAQEGGNVQQLFTKLLPANLAAVDTGSRNAIGDSSSITKGTGRIALAPLPQEEGFLLAYEDTRGMAPLDGFVLDTNGEPASEAIRLLDRIESDDSVFLSPRLVSAPEEGSLLLYAAIGNFSLDGGKPEELPLLTGRLVRRVLDPADLVFSKFGSDFRNAGGVYPGVNIFFAPQAHAVGALAGGNGAVSFLVTSETLIAVDAVTLDSVEPPPPPPPQPPPPPAPPSGSEDDGGGGAMFALLFLLPLLRRARRPHVVGAGLLLLCPASQASPPDVELLHSGDARRACYRAVMYREVTAIHLGVTWGDAVFPLDMAIEIEDLPSGWSAEKIAAQNGKAQVVLLTPAPFDTATGISIGKVCLAFARDVAGLDRIPYTYELAATGSRINAKARPDDGVSEDELRAMVKRGERLKNSADPLAKPKQLEETAKTAKRLKGLFD